jgi:Putative DNA-binding domain
MCSSSLMREIPIDLVTIDHIRDLQANNVREGRQLDYKRDLPGHDDKAKREMLADVSAVANTVGGDIVWGIEELRDDAGKNTGLIGKIVGLKEPLSP